MGVGHKAYQAFCVPVPELELGLHSAAGTQNLPDPVCPCPGVIKVRVTQWEWDTKYRRLPGPHCPCPRPVRV